MEVCSFCKANLECLLWVQTNYIEWDQCLSHLYLEQCLRNALSYRTFLFLWKLLVHLHSQRASFNWSVACVRGSKRWRYSNFQIHKPQGTGKSLHWILELEIHKFCRSLRSWDLRWSWHFPIHWQGTCVWVGLLWTIYSLRIQLQT